MTSNGDAPSVLTASPNARRNFILQQGLCDPAAETCRPLYSALLLQPRIVGVWVVIATILQIPPPFFALTAVLWWSALIPRFNPFDALHNWLRARASRITLTPAPPPRRFAQFLAGTFALTIGICLAEGWRLPAYILEGVFIAAIAALVFGGFCLGSFVYHILRGRAGFAKRTLPWATSA
jgi:hypothetical protein